jgi:hypothetical protein
VKCRTAVLHRRRLLSCQKANDTLEMKRTIPNSSN